MSDPVATARELERRLSPRQLDIAFAMMRAAGWGPGSTPPTWCWIQVYSDILANEKTPPA